MKLVRLPRVAAALLFVTLPLSGATPPTAAADPAIELPTYTVVETRELPPPEHWSYARMEGFEILSNASESATRKLLRDFQRFSQALEIAWPGMQRRGLMPTVLIICGRGEKFEQFAPAEDARADRGKVSLGYATREQSAIVIDYEAKVLDVVLPGGSLADTRMEIDPHQQLFREYTRFLLGAIEPPVPPWFVEGMAQILMAMEISSTQITIGRIEDPNLRQLPSVGDTPEEWDRTFNGALQGRALMPMDELLRVTADSPEARNPIGGVWAKQSAAFVHWGLYGNNRRDQKAFLNYLKRVSREPISEALFKECLKLSYKDMLAELRSYIDFTVYRHQEFRAKKGQKLPDLPPLVLRDATEAEVGRLKGDALRLAGRPAEARAVMLAAYIRGERDPALLAALGVQERIAGHDERARKLLEAVAPVKPLRPRAYLELAKLRLIDAKANPAGERARLTEAQVNAVLAPLRIACDQAPDVPLVYELVATTWLAAASPPAPAQLGFVDEGVRRFPRHTALLYDAAVLKIRAGVVGDARTLIRMGLAAARDPETRATFEALQASLPPQAPAAAK